MGRAASRPSGRGGEWLEGYSLRSNKNGIRPTRVQGGTNFSSPKPRMSLCLRRFVPLRLRDTPLGPSGAGSGGWGAPSRQGTHWRRAKRTRESSCFSPRDPPASQCNLAEGVEFPEKYADFDHWQTPFGGRGVAVEMASWPVGTPRGREAGSAQVRDGVQLGSWPRGLVATCVAGEGDGLGVREQLTG